jgi:hypothetical protein
MVSVGSVRNDVNCGLFASDCHGGNSRLIQAGGGWRFGIFSIEARVADYGSVTLSDSVHQRTRSYGAGVAWTAEFWTDVHGVLRVGVNQLTRSRSAYYSGSDRTANPYFGLGIQVGLAPAIELEVAAENMLHILDDGPRDTFSVGLRFHF